MASKWIWPFELLDKLGEGGMGVVYRARYVGNNRIVAVKLLPDEIAQNSTLVARFDRELEILNQLRHPNIVHCFGGATESKQRFYAMELVEGGTLSEQLAKRGRLSWDHVCEYGIQICAALNYAHERGVIHRDIKPANFLIAKSGKLKLSDFGLATIVAGQKITTAGKTAGTFLYMAPEQIRGNPPLSNRTDLYALGCVFHELLTGRPPFLGDAPAEILHKHLKEAPPRLSSELIDCPPAMEKLVLDLLRKHPDQRPATAAEVQSRLESILRPSLVNVDPFARTPSTSHPVVAVSTPLDSDEADMVASRSPTNSWPWVIATVLLLLVTLSLGSWAISASHRADLLQKAWMETALQPGPGQLVAIQRLAEFPEVPDSAVDQLVELLKSTDDGVRVEVLKLLAKRTEQGRPFSALIVNLSRTEASQQVRQEAMNTLQILRDAKERAPIRRGYGWIIGLVLLALSAGGGWWAWIAWKPLFAKRGP